jgi:hypothetical protein
VGKGKNKRAYNHLNGIDKSNKLKQKYIENLKEKGNHIRGFCGKINIDFP